MCVPWPFPQVMVRERVQWTSILTVISRDNTYDMGVRAHDDPSISCQDAPPFTVDNDTRDEIDPMVEIEP